MPHVPQRTCIACRQGGDKPELLRIVRTPQGEVQLDSTGKVPGRGAYLCRKLSCLTTALKQKKLSRALGVAMSDEVAAALQQRYEVLQQEEID